MLWLRQKRQEKGLRQEDVADRAGIARTTYANYEQGYRNVNVKNAKRISDILGFHWTLFFEDEIHETCTEREKTYT